MKKTLLVIAMFFTCIALFAQNKGDKCIAFALYSSFGSQDIENSNGSYSTTTTSPLNTSLSFQAEYGYFAVDNIRLAMCIATPYVSIPTCNTGASWLHSKMFGVQVNPNIAYYLALSDRLYYTPEIGCSFGYGSYKEQLSANTSYKANYTDWSFYFNFLALEYKINEKTRIGTTVANLSYDIMKIKDENTNAYLGASQFLFNMNSASVLVRFYF